MLEAMKVLGAASQLLREKPPVKVEFSIPKSHPKAEEIRKVFSMLATHIEDPSGFTFDGPPDDQAFSIAMKMIGDVVGHDRLERAIEKVKPPSIDPMQFLQNLE